jgi:SAM-dependent methyltransferase
MWLPIFACECGRVLSPARLSVVRCAVCGVSLDWSEDVLRCVRPERLAAAEPFLAQYRAVRERDGYRSDRAAYYRSLPGVAPDDPQRQVWGIRRRSFEHLTRWLRSRRFGDAPAVLDIGAGSAWLSYRLAQAGCRSVAVDLLVDGQDGLGAHTYYDVRFPCVQADFDALPFAPRQFDVVVFNGSLHYSPDVSVTLARAGRMLAAGGALAVIDSPVFREAAHGLAMRERFRARLRLEYGMAAPIEPGEGFLTFAKLAESAGALGASPRFVASRGGVREQIRRLAARCRGRVPAAFGVWVAT